MTSESLVPVGVDPSVRVPEADSRHPVRRQLEHGDVVFRGAADEFRRELASVDERHRDA